MAPITVGNDLKLKALLTHITEHVQKEEEQLLFIDLEGVNLGRSGQISIMQILMPPVPIVYLVDVHVLGSKAFDTTADDGTSLKTVLESSNMFKVFFDIRNDSDALHACFGVNVAGIIDLQVIEFATRNPRGNFVNGLAKCIEHDLPYIPSWSITKDKGCRLFLPELGGQFEVFLERPLNSDIVKYCEQDVLLMPRLLACYGPKLHQGVAAQLSTIVNERIRLSKSPTYNGKGRHMAIGPYLSPARNYRNLPTSREVGVVCSTRLEQLCHLDDTDVHNLTNQFDTLLVQGEPPEPSSSEMSTMHHEIISDLNPSVANATDVTSTEPPTFTFNTHSIFNDRDLYGDTFEDDWHQYHTDSSGDHDNDLDFTACSAEDCGYCGKCDY